MVNARTKFISIVERVPLVGGLIATGFKDFKEACEELLILSVASTMPVWLGTFIALMIKGFQGTSPPAQGVAPPFTFYQLILSNLGTGELFLYSTAALAPLPYFMWKEGASPVRPYKPFRSGRFINFIALIITVLCAAGFAVIRLSEIAGLKINFDQSEILLTSGIIYFLALFVSFLASIYRNQRESGSPFADAENTQSMVETFNERLDL